MQYFIHSARRQEDWQAGSQAAEKGRLVVNWVFLVNLLIVFYVRRKVCWWVIMEGLVVVQVVDQL